MKNPFPDEVIARTEPLYTEEQATCAAHAINTHDKLVKMLRKLDDGTRQCPVCKANFGFDKYNHLDDCELAALLSEEQD